MAFVKEFAANSLAYVRAFRDTGRVDIAYIEYLFRANDLDGVLLVNGTPSIIDVDDYKFLSQEDLRKNDDYAALLQKYPNVSVFPGDRYQTGEPKSWPTADDGLEFHVEYLLQDGCHACARIGTLVVDFVFDGSDSAAPLHFAAVSSAPAPNHREGRLESCLGRAIRYSQEVHRRRSCAARSLLSRRYEISRRFR